MKVCHFPRLWMVGLICSVSVAPTWGDGLFDAMKAGKHKHTRESHIFPRKHAADEPICDIIALANKLDIIEEGLRDDGIIGIKTPDVWGQSRMTLYRRQFEEEMAKDLGSFSLILSARNARLDTAAFENSFSLALALQGAKGGTGSDLSSTEAGKASAGPSATASATIEGKPPEVTSLLKDSLSEFSSQFEKGGIGVEPTIYLDQKKRYLDHLNELRRVNLGDDLSDSAGYGLYLIRFPVSIQPGQKTLDGHGAEISLTARPEMTPGFVADTFKQLVIEDLVDDMVPRLLEIIRTRQSQPDSTPSAECATTEKATRTRKRDFVRQETDLPYQFVAANLLRNQPGRSIKSLRSPASTLNVSSTVIKQLYKQKNLDAVVSSYLESREIVIPRYADLSNFLRKELQRVSQCCMKPTHQVHDDASSIYEQISGIERHIEECEYEALDVTHTNFHSKAEASTKEETFDAALTWLLMARSAELNIQLKEDIARELHDGDLSADEMLSSAQFYNPGMLQENAGIFETYVLKRWPIVTFAIDPVVDQQNIADSLSYRRDLQLATAFALATGKMSISNASKFSRSLQEDAETIALNRTVTSFAFGNETFGWRFYPRFQLPPNERNNVKILADLLVRGGRGRNYRMKNAKLEPGQRELTAVIVMPSFLRTVRFNVAGNWFKLNQPDDMRITTARQLEQGRYVQELETVCAEAHNSGCYRQEDIEGVDARIRRLEAMLPMQTYTVSLPYENHLSGRELFIPGTSALSPHLFGYEGADTINEGTPCHLLLYGKHFSIGETVVIAGGRKVDFSVISRELIEVIIPESVQPTQVALFETEGVAEMVEISVTTANGISNRIYVPYASKPAPPEVHHGSSVTLDPAVICYKRIEDCKERKLEICSNATLKFVVEDECDVYPSCVKVSCKGTEWVGSGKLNIKDHRYEIEAKDLLQRLLDEQISSVDSVNPAKPATLGPVTISQKCLGYEFACTSGNTIKVVFKEDPCSACVPKVPCAAANSNAESSGSTAALPSEVQVENEIGTSESHQ
ncbi:hypothetical protein K2X85_05710 [bacterium]|nr:hypothetical protein [bacterium]